MGVKVILIVRETLNSTAAQLVSANDKRKGIITRFASISGYSTNIIIKKISGSNITYDEMKEFFDDVNSDMSGTDLLYFIDEKSSSVVSATDFNSLNTVYGTLLTTQTIQIIYLGNVLDNCNNFDTTYSTAFPNITFYKAKSPKSLLGVVSTINSWNYIFTEMNKRMEDKATARLTSLVINGDIIAATMTPRILNLNILMAEIDEVDIALTQPCRSVVDYSRTNPSYEATAFYYFFIGALIIILGLWLVRKLDEKKK